MKVPFAILAGLALLAPAAHAAVTFDYIFDGGYPMSVSYDGNVITGNLTSTLGAFRWTQATGPAYLGRLPHAGAGGVPAISADGTRIASQIAMVDSSYSTWGLWQLGSGWQQLMPPAPADGGLQDGSYGSVWGLSGDGNTVVGLYWRPGHGRGHAAKWTQAAGVEDLGGVLTGQSSRANGANNSGSVIVGWVETPQGPWRPAAWVNGSLQLLTDYVSTSIEGTGEARVASPSGDIIAGFSADAIGLREVTMWKRTNGVFGPPQLLGAVEGSSPGYAQNVPYGMSADGKVIVGYCSFDGDPFTTTGFIWTPQTGVIDINVFLADNDVFVDPNFTIKSMTAMTPDGSQLFGYGQMLTPPYTRKAFRITMPKTVGVPETPSASRLELSAPRPNPSSGESRLDFALTAASTADLSIFDAAGRRVATLVHSELPAGPHSLAWDGRDETGSPVPVGIYLVRLTTDLGARTQRIVRLH